MTASVFIATSLDGFIARLDGSIDWLPQPEEGGEDNGYDAFMAGIDAMVMGRKTFATVLGFGMWPYGATPVFVLSTKPLEGTLPAGARAERLEGDPAEIMASLEKRGCTNLYVDGGDTIQRFMRERLIKRLIITRIPILLGTGIPLFGTIPHDIAWTHRRTTTYPSGLVQSEYMLKPAEPAPR
jgi:dihydrofolate reductase